MPFVAQAPTVTGMLVRKDMRAAHQPRTHAQRCRAELRLLTPTSVEWSLRACAITVTASHSSSGHSSTCTDIDSACERDAPTLKALRRCFRRMRGTSGGTLTRASTARGGSTRCTRSPAAATSSSGRSSTSKVRPLPPGTQHKRAARRTPARPPYLLLG